MDNGDTHMRRTNAIRKERATSATDVDAYIKAASVESRTKLRQLRKIIKLTAPTAKEGISYKMPYYNYHGSLVWFAAFKNHVGIFLRPPIIEEHNLELKRYVTTKSAVHFPMNQPLPEPLIKKLVKARMTKNIAAAKER